MLGEEPKFILDDYIGVLKGVVLVKVALSGWSNHGIKCKKL